MSAIEIVTITVSSIAIGAAVVSILLFVLYTTFQRRLILRLEDERYEHEIPSETASVIRLLDDSFKDEFPDGDREVIKTIVYRYSQTSLTSVLSDPTERFYLFEALTNPSKLPWESRGQRGERAI